MTGEISLATLPFLVLCSLDLDSYFIWKQIKAEINFTHHKQMEELCLGRPLNSVFMLSYPRHADLFWMQSHPSQALIYCSVSQYFCNSMSSCPSEEERTIFIFTVNTQSLPVDSSNAWGTARICFQLLLCNSWVSLIHQKNLLDLFPSAMLITHLPCFFPCYPCVLTAWQGAFCTSSRSPAHLDQEVMKYFTTKNLDVHHSVVVCAFD